MLVRYGIGSVAFERYEGGVLETGTEVGANWQARPLVPIMPKAEMRKAFEELGALYVTYWVHTADSNSDVGSTARTESSDDQLNSVATGVQANRKVP